MVLDSVSTPAGDIPSGTYGFVIEQESNSKREYVIGTLAGNILTFTHRDVSPVDGETEDSSSDDARQKHRKGSSLKLTNYPILTQIYRMLSGDLGIDHTNPAFYANEPTLLNREELATVGYVLDTVNGGEVSYARLVISGNGGETFAAGAWIYFNTTDQEWYKADADTSYAIGTQFGVAQGAGSNGAAITGGILIKGIDTNQSGMVAGSKYYLSQTAGEITATPPTNQFFVGTAKTATAIIVNFDASQLFQIKTGMIMPYAASAAPTGWLACDGSNKSVATYLDLFNVLKTDNLPYGVGTANTVTADDATDTFTSGSHGLNNGDIVFVRSTGTLPTGVTADTPYYIVNKTTNTFQLALTAGGSAIDITTAGSGTHSWYNNFKVPDLRARSPLGYAATAPTLAFNFLDAAVNTGTEEITIDSNLSLYTGQAVALTNVGGALPTGLSATTYYVIRVSATVIKLATSRANADDGTAVNITAAAGGGTHTLTLTLTQRLLGVTGGEETHVLQTEELASHTHTVVIDNNTGAGTPMPDENTTGGNSPSNYPTAASGSDEAHNNMPPFTVINYIIKI